MKRNDNDLLRDTMLRNDIIGDLLDGAGFVSLVFVLMFLWIAFAGTWPWR